MYYSTGNILNIKTPKPILRQQKAKMTTNPFIKPDDITIRRFREPGKIVRYNSFHLFFGILFISLGIIWGIYALLEMYNGKSTDKISSGSNNDATKSMFESPFK